MADPAALTTPTETAPDPAAALRARVRGTNINERSLLATDYLNHFNEVVMMLDLVPDMPECLDEVRAWQPRGYKDHFRDSTFHDRDLAIEAYDHAPRACRAAFEDTIRQLDRLVARSIVDLDAAIAHGDAERTAHVAAAAVRRMQGLIDVASALINGETPSSLQREIDTLLDG
jgi:hypothetical protein